MLAVRSQPEATEGREDGQWLPDNAAGVTWWRQIGFSGFDFGELGFRVRDFRDLGWRVISYGRVLDGFSLRR